jgi:hypothetical protein
MSYNWDTSINTNASTYTGFTMPPSVEDEMQDKLQDIRNDARRLIAQALPKSAAPSEAVERTKEARDFIRRVSQQLSSGPRSAAIDIVYEELDSLLLSSRFVDARVRLTALAQSDLPLAICLSALTVTFPWRVELDAVRTALSKRTKKLALEVGGDEKVRQIARFL